MLLAPHRVGRLGALGDGRVGALEDEADVQVRVLGLDEEVLGPIRGLKPSLGLHHDPIGQLKVQGVGVLYARHRVLDLDLFEDDRLASLLEGFGIGCLKARPEAVPQADSLSGGTRASLPGHQRVPLLPRAESSAWSDQSAKSRRQSLLVISETLMAPRAFKAVDRVQPPFGEGRTASWAHVL